MCIRRYEDKKQENAGKEPDDVEQLSKRMREVTLETMNLSLRLSDFQESRWTASQSEFIRALILKYHYQVNEHSQREIAQEFGISAQLLNNKMKTTNVMTYIEAKQSIQKLLRMEEKQWK